MIWLYKFCFYEDLFETEYFQVCGKAKQIICLTPNRVCHSKGFFFSQFKAINLCFATKVYWEWTSFFVFLFFCHLVWELMRKLHGSWVFACLQVKLRLLFEFHLARISVWKNFNPFFSLFSFSLFFKYLDFELRYMLE